MSDLNVQYAQIEGMIAQLRSFKDQIETRTGEVEKKFAGLLADEAFKGLAANAFNDASTMWKAKIQEMVQNLHNIQMAVDVAQGEISATDSGLTGTFSVV